MARTELATSVPGPVRDHGFHRLRVAGVVRETADASSFVLEVPEELRRSFAYQAGQFCNLRVEIDGTSHVRCYSMSSSPALGEPLQVTVKRVPGGVVSNWLVDHLGVGDEIDVGVPAGFFQLTPVAGDLVTFAAGSGITPVFSLLKTALATTGRRARLLYANRDRDSIIFDAELRALEERHGGRLSVAHHLDAEDGYVTSDDVRSLVDAGWAPPGAEYYVCGPGPFMDIVEEVLLAQGVDEDRLHIERFTPAELLVVPEPVDGPAGTATRVTVELNGRTDSTDHRPGATILQTARQMGMSPPFSCESGSCATCMARLVEGTVSMFTNNALTADEVEDGWILTCQSVPTSGSVRVVYEP